MLLTVAANVSYKIMKLGYRMTTYPLCDGLKIHLLFTCPRANLLEHGHG